MLFEELSVVVGFQFRRLGGSFSAYSMSIVASPSESWGDQDCWNSTLDPGTLTHCKLIYAHYLLLYSCA